MTKEEIKMKALVRLIDAQSKFAKSPTGVAWHDTIRMMLVYQQAAQMRSDQVDQFNRLVAFTTESSIGFEEAVVQSVCGGRSIEEVLDNSVI